MGLGKTIQVIGLLCYLLQKGQNGPYLIVVPLSTLSNWRTEFARFAKDIPVVIFYGKKEERRDIKPKISKKYYFDGRKIKPVVITNYHTIISEYTYLQSIAWKYVVVDEGHCLKNFAKLLFR